KAWSADVMGVDYDVVPLDGALLGPQAVWQASGHIQSFHDPMVDCMQCKHRFRADDIDVSRACSHCGAYQWTSIREFNMMFKTHLGASVEQSSTAYLRPETAQAVFINFKNVMTSMRLKIPFGIAQIGKAFRNEITPKQFLFRVREFEQMEFEWFCAPDQANDFFSFWCERRLAFYQKLGISADSIRLRAHTSEELSHYSCGTSDIEYRFPFGWKELEGIANRGNFDLTQHSKFSGKDLSIYDETTKSSYVPHIIECSVGLGRLFLALLCQAYAEDTIDGETRILLRLSPSLAPIKAAFLPLTKQQAEPMEALYRSFKQKGYSVEYDLSGSIGKRYRRQDEIGTPYCFTYDFDSPVNSTVTVRYRDTTKQERVSIDQLEQFLGLPC
ncbi:MAG TPA: glycine--tRNA ligase, partial [Candidatus Babeliaceae bacterium]|nr:glycine--tRNA ligase [Candidatus Babeliaceae bacterium]